MSAQPIEEDGAHRCVSANRCMNKVDGKPRHTEKADSFCNACLHRVQERIEQLPEQWVRLRHMIGERHAGVDVNIRRPKASGNVPLNLHIDTLLGDIASDLMTAAEVVADKMNIDNPDPQEPGKHIQTCVRIVAPNLHVLMAAAGVGGREADDKSIDVMRWTAGVPVATTTTGVDIVRHLDHLGSLAYYTLGLTRARTQRDIPCSRCRARTVGRWAGADYFDCQSCGSEFAEDDIRRQDKILIELHKRGLIQASEVS